jgi:hypothetical protein
MSGFGRAEARRPKRVRSELARQVLVRRPSGLGGADARRPNRVRSELARQVLVRRYGSLDGLAGVTEPTAGRRRMFRHPDSVDRLARQGVVMTCIRVSRVVPSPDCHYLIDRTTAGQPCEQARFGLTEGDLTDHVHFAAGLTLCWAAGWVVTDLEGGPVRTRAADEPRGPGGSAGRRRRGETHVAARTAEPAARASRVRRPGDGAIPRAASALACTRPCAGSVPSRTLSRASLRGLRHERTPVWTT